VMYVYSTIQPDLVLKIIKEEVCIS
ncbi:hypothetical protein SAMN04488601_10840, partial [Paenibacillus sp. 453mf]